MDRRSGIDATYTHPDVVPSQRSGRIVPEWCRILWDDRMFRNTHVQANHDHRDRTVTFS